MTNQISEDHHSEKKGRIISRREALRLFAASPFILTLAGCSNSETHAKDSGQPMVGSCVVRPELTEGPFYVDTGMIRSDVREDREGAFLKLNFNVQRISGETCSPLEDALVDIWHADANGDYSGVGSFRDDQFLRGVQSTDTDGNASFTTIYPGWYRGRTPHIHFKVRSAASSNSVYEFTSQLFFRTELSEQIYQQEPYRARGLMDTENSDDWIYRRAESDMLLAVTETDNGYEASFDLALYTD